MIQKFIKDNKLSFEEGCRNSTITTIIGYALHLGLTQKDLEKELVIEIENDPFIQDELNRLFTYCKNKNYDKFWKSENAKKQYIF